MSSYKANIGLLCVKSVSRESPWFACAQKCLPCVQVLIISPGRQNLLQERLALGDELWQAEIEAECGIREENPGFMDEIKRAETEGIPILVIMGKNEIQKVRPSCTF